MNFLNDTNRTINIFVVEFQNLLGKDVQLSMFNWVFNAPWPVRSK